MLYSGALKLRERWWQARASATGVTTISVGNLTVGGNGKTPFTLFLASRLRQRGLAVAIISRGWGRKSGNALMVSDGANILSSPRDAGDEPVMMGKSFAGPIAVARRRIDAARLLSAHARFDLFVLDDGFQHLRLRRDLDLILINAHRGLGNGWVLPAGPLRESPGAAARADAVVLIDSASSGTQTPASNADAHLWQLGAPALNGLPLREPTPILRASIRPHSMVCVDRAAWRESPLALAGRRIVAVSGLADSTGFHAMLTRLGAQLVATLAFPDHHDYSPHDFENILAAARGADQIVTTEKDLVKLERFPKPDVSLYALRLAVSMSPDDEARLFDLIAAKMPPTARPTTPRANGDTRE